MEGQNDESVDDGLEEHDGDEIESYLDFLRSLRSSIYQIVSAVHNRPGFLLTEEEQNFIFGNPLHFRREQNKGYWIYEHDNLRDDDSSQSFKAHYRLNKSTFEFLVNKLNEHPAFDLKAHNRTPTNIQVATVLWRYANCHFGYRMVQASLGISQGSYHNFTERFSEALIDQLGHLISCPCGGEEVENVAENFEYPLGRFGSRYLPGVIGAVDGKLVTIHRPGTKSESFRDRKSNLSINLTSVCDSDCMFRYIYVGESGRSHDARVFGRSDLPTTMNSPDVYFPNNTCILGDSAYPLSPFLIVPYTDLEDGNTDPAKSHFNEKLSGMHSCVKRAFGQLTKRWRFLFKYLYVMKHSRMVAVIACCCIFHNLCKYMDDIDDVPFPPDNDDDSFDLIQGDAAEYGGYQFPERNRTEGLVKREWLTTTASSL